MKKSNYVAKQDSDVNKALPLEWIDLGESDAPLCNESGCIIPSQHPSRKFFSPFKTGNLHLHNRFAMAPMAQQLSPEGVPNEVMAAHYASRAVQNGAALIFTEATAIDHPSIGEQFPFMPRLRRGVGEEGHAGLAKAVHAAGGAIFMQLWHPGAHDMGPLDASQVISPSGYWPISGSRGRAATQGDIDELVAAYADASALAQELGYDGVEIHGAHGYLIDQFLWTATNQRNDNYGGTPRNRARFAAEIVAAVRAKTGPNFPISFRLSQWKSRVRGANLADAADLEELLAPISEAGVDLFHVSVRHYDKPAFVGSDLTLAGWVKKITGKSVITVGSVGLDEQGHPDSQFDFSPLAARLERGEFDLVSVGRALLQQPDWVSQQAAQFSFHRNPLLKNS
ncbi:12-oxophytodienoate reductase [Priestia megaterium]